MNIVIKVKMTVMVNLVNIIILTNNCIIDGGKREDNILS